MKTAYREAFSQIEPTQAAMTRLAIIPDTEKKPAARRSVRWGVVAAAAALTVLLLSGMVYAAASWFRLTEGSAVQDPARYETLQAEEGGETGVPDQPDPQFGIVLEDPGEGNYIGFTLDGWSLPDQKNGVNNTMLKELVEYRNPECPATLDPETLALAYTRYFPITPEDERLSVEVLDRDGLGYRDYFTRYETEVVKEGTLNGMETVWLRLQEADAFGNLSDTWHLFCRSETLRCTLVISSNRSFERCEEAAGHVTLVDSGVPLRREGLTTCGLRLPSLPEGVEIDREKSNSMSGAMPGWERKDPQADLSGAYGRLVLVRPADGLQLILGGEANHIDYENVSGFSLNRTGTLNGHEVLWYDDIGGGTALLYRYPDGTQAVLFAHGHGADVEALLEELAVRVELVPVDYVQAAPLEFTGLAQG